jgi:hypothetical protein
MVPDPSSRVFYIENMSQPPAVTGCFNTFIVNSLYGSQDTNGQWYAKIQGYGIPGDRLQVSSSYFGQSYVDVNLDGTWSARAGCSAPDNTTHKIPNFYPVYVINTNYLIPAGNGSVTNYGSLVIKGLLGGGTPIVNYNPNTWFTSVDDVAINMPISTKTCLVMGIQTSQTIDPINTISQKNVNSAPFNINAPKSSSGLPVTLTVVEGPATISGTPGGTYTITLNKGTGTVVIAADQSGDKSFVKAPTVTTSFSVQLATQTISNFVDLEDSYTPYSQPIRFRAPTSSSGLTVSINIQGDPVADVGGQLGDQYYTIVLKRGVTGIVTITASQEGNSVYAAAPKVIKSFLVQKKQQAINQFDIIPDKAPEDAFTLFIPYARDSKLPVTVSVKSGAATVNTINEGTCGVYINNTGTVVLAANQPGDYVYDAAPEVTTSFSVARLPQQIYPISILPNTLSNTIVDIGYVGTSNDHSRFIQTSIKSGPASFSIPNSFVNTLMITNGNGKVVYTVSLPETVRYLPTPDVTGSFYSFDRKSVFYLNPPLITSEITDCLYPFEVSSVSVDGFGEDQNGNQVCTAHIYGKALPNDVVDIQSQYLRGTVQADNIGNWSMSSPCPCSLSDNNGTLHFTQEKDLYPITINTPDKSIGNFSILGISSDPGLRRVKYDNVSFVENSPFPIFGQSCVTLGRKKIDQNIYFPQGLGDKSVDNPPFELPEVRCDANLPANYVVSGPVTISTNTAGKYIATLNGTTGNVVIVASQSGDPIYNPASITGSFTVYKKNQKIYPFSNIEDKVPSTQSFSIVPPIASSLLPVSVSVVSGPASINQNLITLDGSTGKVVLTAIQTGNYLYNPANPITGSFNILKLNQYISNFPYLPESVVPGTGAFRVQLPSSSSKLPVSISGSGVANISGNLITLSGIEGNILLTAKQSGNGDYFPAEDITANINVKKISQQIILEQIPTLTVASGSAKIKVLSSGDSNNPVRFHVNGVASLRNGDTVLLNGQTGTVNITADQSGISGYYYDAPQVSGSFEVTLIKQEISNFKTIPDCYVDSAPFNIIPPTASSNLPVNISVSGPASIYQNTITLSGITGSVTLTATQTGNNNYDVALPVSTVFNIYKHKQSIDQFSSIANVIPRTLPFNISTPTASSNLPVSVSILNGPASLDGNTITLSGTLGKVNLVAVQTGNSIYYPAENVYTSFDVALLPQYINNFTITDKQVDTVSSFDISTPAASSNLPVILSIKDGPASINGNTITLNGTEGIVRVAANQAGNNDYRAADEVISSFIVTSKHYYASGQVNNFFYKKFLLPHYTGAVLSSGVPDGLLFDAEGGVIIGSPVYSGNFNSYIFESGNLTGRVSINLTISGIQTGYLYAYGQGLGYNENHVPQIFNQTTVSQIFANDAYNLAVATQKAYIPPPVPDIPPPPETITLSPYEFPYFFLLKNNSNKDCIDNFTLASNIYNTGNYSGYIDNQLGFGYLGGTPNTTAKSYLITSGYYFGDG